MVEAMDAEGVEFDHDLSKLAAAAEIVDEYAEYEAELAKQAEDLDAAGRLMARSMVDELGKIAAESDVKEEVKEAEEAAPATLSEKLAKAVESKEEVQK